MAFFPASTKSAGTPQINLLVQLWLQGDSYSGINLKVSKSTSSKSEVKTEVEVATTL